eukprot:5338611-Amphidinium_carterae.1
MPKLSGRRRREVLPVTTVDLMRWQRNLVVTGHCAMSGAKFMKKLAQLTQQGAREEPQHLFQLQRRSWWSRRVVLHQRRHRLPLP